MEIPFPPGHEQLAAQLAGPGPSLSLVSGRTGMGKTRLLRELVREDPAAVYYRALPLPDPDHRTRLAAYLERWADGDADLAGQNWSEMIRRVAEVIARTRRRLVLVLDDAHRLAESRSRLAPLVAEGWSEIRARSLPVHLVLAGRSPPLRAAFAEENGPLRPLITLDLQLEPLDFRAVAERLVEWTASDRLLAWGVLGGRPSRLRHIETRVTLATNVQRLVLEPDGPLFNDVERELEEETSSAARYAGILRALAGGAEEWGDILAARPDLESGGQMAPYLARLEELGWVRSVRSLDAGPRSRRRRYRIADPFHAFWFHLVLPHLAEIETGHGAEVWARHVRPALSAHMSRRLPEIGRVYLSAYAGERLPSTAREVGSLWGRGYDLDVAGTLRTGPVVYGTTHWTDEPVGEAHDDALAEQVRTTRYGFGREARLRVLFSSGGFTPALVRRAARDRLLQLAGPDDLVGSA